MTSTFVISIIFNFGEVYNLEATYCLDAVCKTFRMLKEQQIFYLRYSMHWILRTKRYTVHFLSFRNQSQDNTNIFTLSIKLSHTCSNYVMLWTFVFFRERNRKVQTSGFTWSQAIISIIYNEYDFYCHRILYSSCKGLFQKEVRHHR